ncbi:tyrosine-type recombinase/integrase [Emticicia sp. 17c]|uniref:tyrosine-type recombinase/integrase n=1 Tax=Emticicia sp. 17c TaxID=3127704 RepID=UPI00301CAD10
MKNINDQLKKGMVVDDLPKPVEKKPVKKTLKPDSNTAIGRFREIVLLNPDNVSSKQISAYNTAINKFEYFLRKRGQEKHPYHFIDDEIVLQFSDFMRLEEKLMPRTINNTFDSLKHLAKLLIKRKLVSENPFLTYEHMREADTDRHTAYSEFEKTIIEKHIIENDKRLYYLTRFLFYAFIRPTELRKLTVGDIDFRKNSIMVWGSKSKNKKRIPIPIVSNLQSIILEMELHKKPSHFFVFGKDLETSPVQAAKNQYLNKHNAALKEIGIYRSNETTLYGWKHTGNVYAYLAGVDIATIKEINRHWSIAETENYLRGLGLILRKEASKLSW